MNNGYSISVKCSIKTIENFEFLFKYDKRFFELGKNVVFLNPSWFFKFCTNYTLTHLVLNKDTQEFAYNSHYVDFLDEKLKCTIQYNLKNEVV